jgi:hypothetical protein
MRFRSSTVVGSVSQLTSVQLWIPIEMKLSVDNVDPNKYSLIHQHAPVFPFRKNTEGSTIVERHGATMKEVQSELDVEWRDETV